MHEANDEQLPRLSVQRASRLYVVHSHAIAHSVEHRRQLDHGRLHRGKQGQRDADVPGTNMQVVVGKG